MGDSTADNRSAMATRPADIAMRAVLPPVVDVLVAVRDELLAILEEVDELAGERLRRSVAGIDDILSGLVGGDVVPMVELESSC